ncbi:unnamed protein product [Zymoseptoria tritici ST99CH_1A5]|uniref:Peptide hydrolase n=2 Tax=Zymoseptoria tritici TaxID=1047171 RepID=F9XBK6_ZYMTI|nr:peptidase M28 [Zymoseptoria tritici IPO323]EGP87101.1 peptidase M28 [Zymoseptoria tritici IPO323]SMY24356.1 unnamed protein product [Zymoseptoria tritici ST99CH_1A5]
MKLLHPILLLPVLLRSTAAYTPLSDATLRSLPSPDSDFDIETGALLAPILRTRVPGTEGSRAVLAHFVDFFTTKLPEWKLSIQNSTSTTPTSNGEELPFHNLIATRDPPWAEDGDVGRLALVAHYDSKLEPKGFIGATDSAAPCAMLMHAARSIDAALTKKWAQMQAEGAADSLDEEGHKGVQIILLDGEEAFHSWTDTDSLYGARSLAEEWEGTAYGALSTYRSPLASIDLFVLLDLLGSKSPKVPSYFKLTHWAYKLMADAEKRLREVGRFKSSPNHASKAKRRAAAGLSRAAEPMFLYEGGKDDTSYWSGGGVSDDHLPFMARGVDILHIITSPFPKVWHKMEDDGEHLDMDTVEDWALLTIAFAAEWLDLEGYMDAQNESVEREVEFEKSELSNEDR